MMSGMYAQYLSDPEVAALCSDENVIRHMLAVEIELAQVQAELGVIPQAAAKEIREQLTSLNIDPDVLSGATLKNGIPTIPFLAIAKLALSAESKDYLHWGATSQDIMDTVTILVAREVVQVLETRLRTLIEGFKALSSQHLQTMMVARTRMQQAVPISFEYKVQTWLRPLERQLSRLQELKPRLFVIQLGGAGGMRSALGEQGDKIAEDLAQQLGLGEDGVWHSQRDRLTEFASWMGMLGAALGKVGQDILLMSQSEIGELIENKQGGGKSSTMPHKNNPVLSEALVALSRYLAQMVANHFQAMIHVNERDASAWIIEWLSLPPMMIGCGTILKHAHTITQHIQVNTEVMKANLEKLNGLVYAEKASFLLTEFMSRTEAKAVVGKACQMVMEQGMHLSGALTELLPEIDINWADTFSPSS